MHWGVQVAVIGSLSLLSFFYGFLFATHRNGISPTDCSKSKNLRVEVPEGTETPSIGVVAPVSSATDVVERLVDPLQARLIVNRNQKKATEDILTYENANPLVLEEVFTMFHHPSHPLVTELLLQRESESPGSSLDPNESPYKSCQEVFLTRTGSLANMPNKCVALVVFEADMVDPVPHYHRRGTIAGLTNMFQKNLVNDGALRTEKSLLPDFLSNYDSLVADFKAIAGDRKEVVVMVLNAGVLDVFLNFICSLQVSNPPQLHILDQLVVFAGESSLVPLLQSLGVKALHNPGLGQIPSKAAQFYGDMTFALLMWLKTTSVLIATTAGYNVLFQDVDLVWLQDPLPAIRAEIQRYEDIQLHSPGSLVVPDILFMDDGARTPRFTPLYVNSGFYYVRANPRSVYVLLRIATAISEIAVSHSHQAVLTRHVHEAIDLVGLRVTTLNLKEYPSGFHYHHEKKYMDSLKAFETRPLVFHMCWTESRKQKVEYLQTLGMWLLPSEGQSELYGQCGTVDALKQSLNAGGAITPANGARVLQQCCLRGAYWEGRDAYDRDHSSQK